MSKSTQPLSHILGTSHSWKRREMSWTLILGTKGSPSPTFLLHSDFFVIAEWRVGGSEPSCSLFFPCIAKHKQSITNNGQIRVSHWFDREVNLKDNISCMRVYCRSPLLIVNMTLESSKQEILRDAVCSANSTNGSKLTPGLFPLTCHLLGIWHPLCLSSRLLV
jgi:hypothetical protein